jgi:hypothetical protein
MQTMVITLLIVISYIGLLAFCFINAIWYPVLEKKEEKKKEISVEERVRYRDILKNYNLSNKDDINFYNIMNWRYPLDTLSIKLDIIYNNVRTPYGTFNC